MMAWRLLFDTVQLHLLPPARDASNQPSGEVELAALGLKEVAAVLATAEQRQAKELDVMWRYWSDLGSMRRRNSEVTSPIAQTHAALTIVLLAYLAHALAETNLRILGSVTANRLATSTSYLADDQHFGTVVTQLMDSSSEDSMPARLWDELVRRDLPERQVVYVPSLRTAVARVVLLRLALRGRLRSPVGEWIASVDDAEMQRLWSDVEMIAERAGTDLPSSRADVFAQVASLRRLGRQAEATRLSKGPLSPVKVASLQRAFAARWREMRDVDVLLRLGGATVLEDATADQRFTTTVSRGFLVEGTNYVGEDTIGAGLAEQIVRSENAAVLNQWIAAASDPPSPGGDLLAVLSEMSADDDWLLVQPIDWSGDRWRESHLAPLFPHLRHYTTALLQDEVVLVNAGAQTWHIVGPEASTVGVEEIPLEASADAANVRLAVDYGLPDTSEMAWTMVFGIPWPDR